MSQSDIGEVLRALGRLEGKLDALLKADLEKRVGALERWRAYTIGIASAVSAAISFIYH